MKKKCYSCQKEKHIDFFVKDKNKKDGHRNFCKKCHREEAKKRRENNKGNLDKREPVWV